MFFRPKYRNSKQIYDEYAFDQNIKPRESLTILKKCGYNQGLCQLLVTNPESGINGDKEDIKRRQNKFGKNTYQKPLQVVDSFVTLAARYFEEPLVIMLIWVTTFYLIISFFNKRPHFFVAKSLSIYSVLLLSCMIKVVCDWTK